MVLEIISTEKNSKKIYKKFCKVISINYFCKNLIVKYGLD